MPIYFKKEKTEKQLKNYMLMDKFPKIEGYNFDDKFDFDKFMGSYINMGFQGSNLGKAIKIFENMLEEKKKGLKIWLSFTGNMISSGNREIIKFLVKNKIIDGVTTTASSIEEDIIKCIKPFHLGSFDVQGKFLSDECIGRIGNIFAPYDRYAYFEKFFNNFFNTAIKKHSSILSASEITNEIGLYLEKDELTKNSFEDSFLYWASKNNIPVFCPGITDGAIGDMTVFFRQKNPGFMIDVAKDHSLITSSMENADKAGCIILGGGIAKHYLLNAAIFRDGFEYSIYITTASEFDGSDSGGNQEEAISWAKIKPDAQRVKIVCDATIAFPLLVASVNDLLQKTKNL
ncbi:deoxyhypusine synthase [Candidatus Woesearchaeota archaeon]|nr:deoxyhypusine synthase [Candidatus Woesearchaeota archaeon]